MNEVGESTDRRGDYIADLRALADFFEQHPDLPVPAYHTNVGVYVEGERFAEVVSALGGKRLKTADGSFFSVERAVGRFTVEVFTSRGNVCEQVQVGTQRVEREEVVTPAVTRTIEVDEPIMEWRCGESILKAAS